MKVEVNLSTPYHPQTDGQTERINQTLEQYLRSYCSYQQDNWADLLPLAEYAYNSAVSESTKLSPFEANYGFTPESNWLGVGKCRYPFDAETDIMKSDWELSWKQMRIDLRKAQDRQRQWYDRKSQIPPEFITQEDIHLGKKAGVPDKVMLDQRNIKTKRPSVKLDHKKFGPFEIVRKVGNRAYELALPPQMKIHPVFHVGLLEPYRQSLDPTRYQSPPPVEEIDGEESWEVSEVVDSRYISRNKRVQYRIIWKVWGSEHAT